MEACLDILEAIFKGGGAAELGDQFGMEPWNYLHEADGSVGVDDCFVEAGLFGDDSKEEGGTELFLFVVGVVDDGFDFCGRFVVDGAEVGSKSLDFVGELSSVYGGAGVEQCNDCKHWWNGHVGLLFRSV